MHRVSQLLIFLFGGVLGAAVPFAFVVRQFGPPLAGGKQYPTAAVGLLMAMPLGAIIGGMLAAWLILRQPALPPGAPLTAYDHAARVMGVLLAIAAVFAFVYTYGPH
jgi:hypothetical protein